jgi:predicted RNase H-like HicB family nuclease
MKITVQITRGSDGFYRARCPALPGCIVVAPTRDEAHTKISEAIEGYLASLDVALPRELVRSLEAASDMCVA